jgi:Cu/Ag efflux protein CusF
MSRFRDARMSTISTLVIALLFFSVASSMPAAPATAEKSAQSARRHPLRGVIVAIDGERSVLTVKHEAIPGVMRAMTMLFRVDAGTIKAVRPGQSITALLSREGDEWWLHDVKAAPVKKE